MLLIMLVVEKKRRRHEHMWHASVSTWKGGLVSVGTSLLKIFGEMIILVRSGGLARS